MQSGAGNGHTGRSDIVVVVAIVVVVVPPVVVVVVEEDVEEDEVVVVVVLDDVLVGVDDVDEELLAGAVVVEEGGVQVIPEVLLEPGPVVEVVVDDGLVDDVEVVELAAGVVEEELEEPGEPQVAAATPSVTTWSETAATPPSTSMLDRAPLSCWRKPRASADKESGPPVSTTVEPVEAARPARAAPPSESAKASPRASATRAPENPRLASSKLATAVAVACLLGPERRWMATPPAVSLASTSEDTAAVPPTMIARLMARSWRLLAASGAREDDVVSTTGKCRAKAMGPAAMASGKLSPLATMAVLSLLSVPTDWEPKASSTTFDVS